MVPIQYFNGVLPTIVLIIIGILGLVYIPRLLGTIVNVFIGDENRHKAIEKYKSTIVETTEREKGRAEDGKASFYQKGF